MTEEHKASRKLVKSAPELWAECSVADSLARHLGGFGEIKITRLEPETAVAWEGTRASGTVRLEPSGWGTRVTLTAVPVGVEDEFEPVAVEDEFESVAVKDDPEPVAVEHEPEPVAVKPEPVEDASAPRRRFARFRALFAPRPASAPIEPEQPVIVDKPVVEEPVVDQPNPEEAVVEEPAVVAVAEAPVEEPAEQPVPPPGDASDPTAVLTAALDSLGQAHHRPFSRA
jgi:hypothetical protein